ncbi:hypothetical protein PGT21_029569 [Puccinia graminis f. sp. tritici]|uniref:C2H2-type domain-containing protein n=1 Tax=Puccinia graminis f. sp. tritici TaxID=56615 RepID=A0A5B0PVE2_PUCGR|nr:hypothetical protein PGT21_029569 [Puccinia graminis f. sp. tritici]
MSHSNGLALGESTSPVNVWADPRAGTLSFESTPGGATMPGVDDFELASYCAGFDGHPGPHEVILPLQDDPNQIMHPTLYSLQMTLPQDHSYKPLHESTTFNFEEGAIGTYPLHKSNETSPNFLLSTTIGYEASPSPLSSRPCTAGYEGEEMVFSPSAPVELSSHGCSFGATDGFSFYSDFDQPGFDWNPSPKSNPHAHQIVDSSPLQYISTSLIPPPSADGLLGPQDQGGANTLIEPLPDFKFQAGPTTAAHSIVPHEISEPYPWSSAAALSHPPRPRIDGGFPHSEVFTTRCVQPTSLMCPQSVSGKPKDAGLESSQSSTYGKASFLPGNWESQGIFAAESVDDSPQPSRRLAAIKQPSTRRKSAAKEPLTAAANTAPNGSKRAVQALSRAADDPPDPQDPAKHSAPSSALNKTPDGKFVCCRISKDTQATCGRKFQRSEHLKRHWATHDELKPFQCHICERFFGRTDNLTQHVKTHANAHGRNTKLLKAKMLQEAEESKGLRKLEHKPTAYYSRSTRRRKLQSAS